MSTWNDIVGHQWAIDLLRSAIAHDRVGHAYLFTGPDYIGKATLARTFAQALNCTSPGTADRPCGQCRSCKLIAAGRHPDIKSVVGETSGRGKVTLKIDQIRQLQTDLNLTAAEARTKVAIVEGFEAANQSAANAFLKTLEEPPGDVVLILTATTADTLLPTITSRCRTFNLRLLPAAAVERALIERWGVETDRAHTLAHLSGGRLGWAVAMAADPDALLERNLRLDLLAELFVQSRVSRFAAAEDLARQPEELPGVLQIWLEFWRDLLMLANGDGATGTVANVDRLDELKRFVQAWSPEAILAGLRHTELALWQLERNANTRLVTENLLLGYPFLPAS